MTSNLLRHFPALATLLALLLAPAALSGQQVSDRPKSGPDPIAAARSATLSELSATATLERLPATALMAKSTPPLSPYVLRGAALGGLVGGAFGFAVISMADCGGPTCNQERVVGVVWHAMLGAAFGALTGGVVYLFRR